MKQILWTRTGFKFVYGHHSVSLSQPQSHMGISAVMAKEIHTLNAPRSRSELFLTTAALDGVFVMRAHRCYIHHGGDHKIWWESANTALRENHICPASWTAERT